MTGHKNVNPGRTSYIGLYINNTMKNVMLRGDAT